ncbi:MAG: hypothetical protein Q4D51_13050 [Eubacteriales bacterium]|nr:hypothetical protein [Eubacteriales bacterium]
MEKKQISKKQFSIYMIMAFGLAWILQIIATVFPFMVKPEYSNLSILGPVGVGIISMLPMLVLAVIICLSRKSGDRK